MHPGARLGQYEIVSLIGAGGMGQVYRARDTRLNREVAIKVLPAALAEAPDRLARFEREAKTLASLNHPNIAQIYGVVDNPPALVMELVEGQDLAERLGRGAVPVEESLAIARQVADALAAAHDRGIVHRDLKPANIKVTPDGIVKVLDFGLAKALGSPGSGPHHEDAPGPDVNAANSPTFSMPLGAAPGATELGMIVGTAAYMSPEQARGKVVDRRTDVWAFGVVLYEMLTGRRAFQAPDVSDVLAAVLRDRVALDTLPASTPPPVVRLLRRCLEKDRNKRLDSMAAARLDIEEALDPSSAWSAPVGSASAPSSATGTSAFRRNVLAVAALAAVLAVTGYVVATRPWKAAAAAPSLVVAIDTGFDGSIVPDLLPEVAFSPDGSTLALAGRSRQRGRSHIYLRRFDQLGAKMLEGTEDASFPFFSPDGQWVGFFVANRLSKVSVNGGAAVPLADVQIPRGATWGDDDVITFAPVAVPGGALMRVPASGGTPTPFGPMLKGHVTQRFPQAIHGSRVLLYTGATNVDSFEDSCLMAQEPGAEPRVVQCGGYAWRYLPEGYVTYVHNGSLFAAPFDLASLKLTGPPHAVVPLLRSMPGSGGAQYAISPGGVLAYVPGETEGERRQLQIFDRSGHGTPLEGVPAGWQSMTLSPDGTQLALGVAGANAGVWVYDFARAAATRLTLGAGDQNPIWTPDGRRITYGAAQNGPPNLWWVAADGSGRPERLLQADSLEVPETWSPDGGTLLFSYGARGKFDIWAIGVGGSPPKAGAPRPFIATPANDGSSSFSPDGKWVAYTSDESGAYQIYVRAASGTGARYQVSVTDGVWATWSRVKPELLLGGLDGQIVSVAWSAPGGVFHASRPEPWTPARYDVRSTFAPFVLLPDGNRVLMAQQQSGAPADKLVLVTNFVNDLQGRK